MRDDFFSDHLTMDITLANCRVYQQIGRYGINIRKVDWQKFTDLTATEVDQIDDRDLAAVQKYNAITEAVKRWLLIFGAEEKKGKRKFAANEKPWWNEESDKVVEDRSSALRALLDDVSLPNLIEKRRTEAIVKRTIKKVKIAYN